MNPIPVFLIVRFIFQTKRPVFTFTSTFFLIKIADSVYILFTGYNLSVLHIWLICNSLTYKNTSYKLACFFVVYIGIIFHISDLNYLLIAVIERKPLSRARLPLTKRKLLDRHIIALPSAEFT